MWSWQQAPIRCRACRHQKCRFFLPLNGALFRGLRVLTFIFRVQGFKARTHFATQKKPSRSTCSSAPCLQPHLPRHLPRAKLRDPISAARHHGWCWRGGCGRVIAPMTQRGSHRARQQRPACGSAEWRSDGSGRRASRWSPCPRQTLQLHPRSLGDLQARMQFQAERKESSMQNACQMASRDAQNRARKQECFYLLFGCSYVISLPCYTQSTAPWWLVYQVQICSRWCSAKKKSHTWESVGAVVEVAPAEEAEHAHLAPSHHLAAALHHRHRQQLIVRVVLRSRAQLRQIRRVSLAPNQVIEVAPDQAGFLHATLGHLITLDNRHQVVPSRCIRPCQTRIWWRAGFNISSQSGRKVQWHLRLQKVD